MLLFGIPQYSADEEASTARICVGANAIELTVVVDIQRALIPILNDVRDARWFGNFDGRIFSENTQWKFSGVTTDARTVTMHLPRSARNQDYQIDDGANVILRATPQLVPFPPNAQFAKFELVELFPDVTPFQCCVASDCVGRTGLVLLPGMVFVCTADRLCSMRPA